MVQGVLTTYLVDNSVWQRLGRSTDVEGAMRVITAHGHRFASCSASLDEASYSARSLDDLRLRARLGEMTAFLDTTPETDLMVRQIRKGLFAAGMGRAAGVVDVQIAAVAISHHATVLHYDQDFVDMAGIASNLSHRRIVPRGSVD